MWRLCLTGAEEVLLRQAVNRRMVEERKRSDGQDLKHTGAFGWRKGERQNRQTDKIKLLCYPIFVLWPLRGFLNCSVVFFFVFFW